MFNFFHKERKELPGVFPFLWLLPGNLQVLTLPQLTPLKCHLTTNYSLQFGASAAGYLHGFIPGYHPAAPASEAGKNAAISKEKNIDAIYSWCNSPEPWWAGAWLWLGRAVLSPAFHGPGQGSAAGSDLCCGWTEGMPARPCTLTPCLLLRQLLPLAAEL